MKVVDSGRMTEIDRRAQVEYGIPALVLLENAGLKSYQYLKDRYWGGRPPEGPAVFVAGKGNNGGDALVIARQCFLDGKRDLTIVTSGDPEPVQMGMCAALGIRACRWDGAEAREAIERSSVLFDGIAGTGLKGALKKPLDSLVGAVNASRSFKVSIDVPSGVGDGYRDGDPAVTADVTVTMGLPKLCLYLPSARRLAGAIHTIAIGFPPGLLDADDIPGELLTIETVRSRVPAVEPDSYKNRRGSVAVFGGAAGTTGAAVLAARAASRSRAGLVTVFAERAVYPVIAAQLAAVMTRAWDDSASPEGFEAERFDALLVGPGWGQAETRKAWLGYFLSSGARGVIDADGLNVLASERASLPRRLGGRWILTPHPGEFSRLSGADRAELAGNPLPRVLALAEELEAVIVYKAHVSIVAAPDGRYGILDGMNPSLGTGGSGDVLGGIIAGFLATGLDAVSAARAGVFAHHLAGRMAFAERGWYSAEELVEFVSRASSLEESAARPPRPTRFEP